MFRFSNPSTDNSTPCLNGCRLRASRVKGSLRTYHATLKTIHNALQSREPKPGDEVDIRNMVVSLRDLIDDKWVQDQMKGEELDAPDQALLERLELAVPSPVTYDKAIDLLVAGLRAVLAEV